MLSKEEVAAAFDTETCRKLFAEQRSLQHAIQTGVAYEHSKGSQDGTPKHLRVGVNSALCFTSAIAALLVAKGLATAEEIMEAEVESLRRELERYESRNKPLSFR